MDIFKIVAIGLIGGMLSVTVKQYKKEYGMLVAIATGAVIFFGILGMLEAVVESLMSISEESGVDIAYFTVIIKVIGVAYVTQLCVEILRDCGEGAIAMKVELGGKILILSLTLPIVKELLEVCQDAILAV